MKLIAATPAAVLAFAVLFSATAHPGPVFLLSMLLGVLGVAWRGRRIASGVDVFFNPAPRRRRAYPFVALALVAGACRPEPRLTTPEPALAEIETLDCGGRSCAVTEVAGATMITVTE